MYKREDEEHVEAMHKMNIIVEDHDAMEEWLYDKAKEFDSLPDDAY